MAEAMTTENGKRRQIRLAKRADLRDLAVFLDDCWRSAYKDILDPHYLSSLSSNERYEKLLSRYEESPRDFLLCQAEDGGIAGAVIFGESTTKSYPNDGGISALYVRADLIGQGYGRALIGRAQAALRARGYRNFVLDVFADNTTAVGFYQAHGYIGVGTENVMGDHLPTCLIMRKEG